MHSLAWANAYRNSRSGEVYKEQNNTKHHNHAAAPPPGMVLVVDRLLKKKRKPGNRTRPLGPPRPTRAKPRAARRASPDRVNQTDVSPDRANPAEGIEAEGHARRRPENQADSHVDELPAGQPESDPGAGIERVLRQAGVSAGTIPAHVQTAIDYGYTAREIQDLWEEVTVTPGINSPSGLFLFKLKAGQRPKGATMPIFNGPDADIHKALHAQGILGSDRDELIEQVGPTEDRPPQVVRLNGDIN